MHTELPVVIEDLIGILQKCRQWKNLHHANGLYTYICEHQLESHQVLGNYLVPVLVECGSLPDAQHVFDSLTHQNEHSWTSLIIGYVDCGKPQHAFHLYQKMQWECCVQPSRYTFLSLLSACARSKDTERGSGLHYELIVRGLERDLRLGSCLVYMYIKCGSLLEACSVFGRLAVRDVVSWAALIAGYAECGFSEKVENCWQQMQVEGISPDSVTFVCSLKACGIKGSLEKGQALHSEITKRGLEIELHIGSTLMDMYSKWGLLAEAHEVFTGLSVQNVITWNTLIAGYAERGLIKEAGHCFQQMQLDGIPPDSTTFVSNLKACSSTEDLETGQLLHDEIIKRGLEGESSVGNILVDTYSRCGSLADAYQVFDMLPVQNAVAWSILIAGYTDHGFYEEALNSYRQMKQAAAFVDEVTLLCSLKICNSTTALSLGQEVHAEIILRGLERDSHIGCALVDLYSKCGLFAEAHQVFDSLPSQDGACWVALASGYNDHGFSGEFAKLYQQMQQRNIVPSSGTFVCSLKACRTSVDLQTGWELHCDILTRGFERELHVGNALIDMYFNCGSPEEASQVFDSLPVRNAATWTALVAGYAELGLDEDVLSTFHQMQFEGVPADALTFSYSLKFCSIIDDLLMSHAEITKRGLEKESYISSTLVSLYMKCCLLPEACRIFERLPNPNAISWNALIAGYVEHGLPEEAMYWFRQMQLVGIPPDSVSSVCSLKACSAMGDIQTLQVLHSELLKRGFEQDRYVGNTLVDAYVQRCSLEETQCVFVSLPVQDAVSWAALIAGSVQRGLGEEVLQYVKQMDLDFMCADAVILVLLFKACGTLRAVEMGREVHIRSIKMGLERDISVGNSLVDMYGKCGLLDEAHHVLTKLSVQDAVSWAALIRSCSEHCLGEEAEKYAQKMQLEDIFPDSPTFICIAKACGDIGALETGQKIHAEVVKRGLETELYVGNTLLSMYTKCGSLLETRQVFDALPVKDAPAWDVLITAYAENGCAQQALRYFNAMQEEEVPTNATTFVTCLKACGAIKGLEIVRGLHAEVCKRGLEMELFVGSTLVDIYAKCDSPAEACKVFDGLPVQNAVSWTALSTVYVDHMCGEEVEKSACHMQLDGLAPDSVMFICTLRACGTIGCLTTGQVIHSETVKRGFERELYVGGSLVDMYAKCHSLVDARQVFDRLPVQDSVVQTALIAGYADQGLHVEVLNCFKQMRLEDVSMCGPTVGLWLKACGIEGALETGRIIHTEISKLGLEDCRISNTLINMYGKCGLVTEARKVFDKLSIQTAVSWTTMIKAYGENHESEKVLQCFEDMQDLGVNPNSVTFTCLLTACSHSSMVRRGQEYFRLMREDYKIEPRLDHYVCMVDLFARSGHFYEAEKFIAAIKCPPFIVILLSLLSACKVHMNMELGQRCFQQLVELNQEDASAYILLADMYASAGRWNDVDKLEEMREVVGAKKMPGRALIEANTTLNEFVVGVRQSEEVSAFVELIGLHMKHVDYVPNVHLVSCSESKRANYLGSEDTTYLAASRQHL